jgi:hypothetical protein
MQLTRNWLSLKKLRCSKFILMHKEIAKARAADSTISTEVESCMYAFINMEKGVLTLVLIMKTPRPATLGGEVLESGAVAASI